MASISITARGAHGDATVSLAGDSGNLAVIIEPAEADPVTARTDRAGAEAIVMWLAHRGIIDLDELAAARRQDLEEVER